MDLKTYENKVSIQNVVRKLKLRGTPSNLANALKEVTSNQFVSHRGDRQNVPNYAVVVFAGKSRDPRNSIQEASIAHKRDIDVLSIGVSQNVDEYETKKISSPPQKPDLTYWRVPYFNALKGKVNPLTDIICTEKTHSPKESHVPLFGMSPHFL